MSTPKNNNKNDKCSKSVLKFKNFRIETKLRSFYYRDCSVSKSHHLHTKRALGEGWCKEVYGGVWRCTQHDGGFRRAGAVLVVYDCMQCCDTMPDDYIRIYAHVSDGVK